MLLDVTPPLKIRFLPFWEPHIQYASTRLRALFPALAMRDLPGTRIDVGWDKDADIYVVVQLCSDRTLDRLTRASSRGSTILYSVCDRHFANGGVSVAGVQTKWRFEQLAQLAHAFIVPTQGMADELAPYHSGKKIAVIPDWKDYIDYEDRRPVEPNNRVIWFGNAGTGNFRSVEPFLKILADSRFDISAITNVESVNRQSTFPMTLLQWRYETFVSELRKGSFSVIAFDPSESQKSLNRLASSIMNGVPAVLCGPSVSADLVSRLGFESIAVKNRKDLRRAIAKVQDRSFRSNYIRIMQDYFDKELSPSEIIKKYCSIFDFFRTRK